MRLDEDISGERKLAYVLLRMTLGVDFLGHGAVRLLHGDGAFAAWMVKTMAETPLPVAFVHGFGMVLPWLELALGLLLVGGLWTRGALVAGSMLMMSLMVGTSLKQEWPSVGLQLGYGALIAVLLFLREPYDAGWLELLRRA